MEGDALGRRGLTGISDQNAQVFLRALAGEQIVGAQRVRDGEAVRNQRADAHLAGLDQGEESFHVPFLGPAHKAVGVIDTTFLVTGVVAAWAVGARVAHLQFLLVVKLARNIDAHVAHDYHDAAIAGEPARELNRLRRAGGRGDDDRVRPFSAPRGAIPRTLALRAALAGTVPARGAPEPHPAGSAVGTPSRA